jgi:hypothetical protein
LRERLVRFAREPFELAADPHHGYLKRRAVENYESLQRGFARTGRDLRATAAAPERYWRLRF